MLKKGFTRLTNEALANLASATIKIVTDTNNKTFTENAVFNPIQEAYDAYRRVLNKATYSGMGTEIAAKDARRDNMYLGLKEIVTGMSRFSREVSKYRDAEKLMPIFRKYGSMNKKPYLQQSAVFTSFCNGMAKENNAIHLRSYRTDRGTN